MITANLQYKSRWYDAGPTIEIFQYYQETPDRHPSNISYQGFGHIALVVDNVEEVLNKLIECGGKKYVALEKKVRVQLFMQKIPKGIL
ncbi:VOC family protein [Pseudalkalibacillus sp. A8]|uniref:VOC family protein n=1 Tax=Pseudalkalibacillus sp. A8 TaxID=3382641 RepID=UPI0038B55C7B